MDVLIEKSALHGSISAIPSKSDAHRAMIAAALSEEPCFIKLNMLSEDTEATISCLKAMGAEITRHEDGWRIKPIDKEKPAASPLLNCGESGSTLRFLLPLAALLCEHPRFEGRGRLPERPLGPLFRALHSHGVEPDAARLPFTLQGRLHAGDFHIPGGISSQFVSGLLFALPLLKEDSRIMIQDRLESESYAEMTARCLSRFGVCGEKTETGYYVKGAQKYHAPQTYSVEGDWSSAAFFIGADSLAGNDISVTGLDESSVQPDKNISKMLAGLGGELDVSACPDLFPILAVCAAFHEGTTRFTGGARLRIKESDRISAMAEGLRAMGAELIEYPEGMEISGGKALHGAKVDVKNDHRIAMAMSIAGSLCGRVHIRGAECVKKSYPLFFEHFRKLGGKAYVI